MLRRHRLLLVIFSSEQSGSAHREDDVCHTALPGSMSCGCVQQFFSCFSLLYTNRECVWDFFSQNAFS